MEILYILKFGNFSFLFLILATVFSLCFGVPTLETKISIIPMIFQVRPNRLGLNKLFAIKPDPIISQTRRPQRNEDINSTTTNCQRLQSSNQCDADASGDDEIKTND
jgi:hypothetical protein